MAMPDSKRSTWGIRREGLCITIDGMDEIVIPASDYPSLILTLVRELKRAMRDREGREGFN